MSAFIIDSAIFYMKFIKGGMLSAVCVALVMQC